MANDNLNNQQGPNARRSFGKQPGAEGVPGGQRPQGQPGAAGAPRAGQRPAGPQGQMPGRAQGAPSARARTQAKVPGQRPQAGGTGDPGKPGIGKLADAAGKLNTKRTVLLIAGVVVAALAIWLLVWLFACNGSSLLDPTAQNGQAPYKSAEEMQAELDRVVEEGMFNISIASVIQFEDGTSNGTAYIENVPGNHYLMKVNIIEDDTGDLLYESGLLKPDQFIENITLAKDLDAGTYDATATFTALDQTTYDEVGQAAAKVTINVLN